MKKTRVAVVGFGFMGRTHVAAWQSLRGAELVAVCDANLAQLTAQVKGNLAGVATAQALPASVRIWDDFAAMLAAGDLDVVDITLPTPLHAPFACQALAAGCHVLCEKPMALTVADCDRMLAAARKARRILLVAQCVRFFPEYAYLAKIVKSGRYGKVVAGDFTRYMAAPKWSPKGGSWLLDEAQSGGLYLDAHIHDVDFIRSILGDPASLHSVAHRAPAGFVDHLTTTYTFANGAVVSSSCSWAATDALTFDAAARVFLERATVYLGGAYRAPLTIYPQGRPPVTPKLSATSGYAQEIAYFLACVRGRAPAHAILTAQDGRDAVALACAERASSATVR